ncbi:hypothetical protein [Natranaerovirga pectinivora]|nr:hypothetical protein [Natranaerovirga pectinivora]
MAMATVTVLDLVQATVLVTAMELDYSSNPKKGQGFILVPFT